MFDIYGLVNKIIMVLNYEIINYDIFIICMFSTKYWSINFDSKVISFNNAIVIVDKHNIVHNANWEVL